MLRAHILVLEPGRFVLGALGRVTRTCGEVRLIAAVGLSQPRQVVFERHAKCLRVDLHLVEQRGHDAVGLLEERKQQVFRFQFSVLRAARPPLGIEKRFLGLLGVGLDVHDVLPVSRSGHVVWRRLPALGEPRPTNASMSASAS